MRKYLAGLIVVLGLAFVVVVLGLAFVVARQDQRAADQSAQKAAELHKAAPTAITDEHHPQEKVYKPDGDSPSWDFLLFLGLFRWPIGTGTWVIVLTLFAIAEQTSQTRKAAEATRSSAKSTEDSVSAFIAAQGPQITVIAHGKPPNDLFGDPPRVQMELHNQGPTTARELSYEFWIEVLPWKFFDFTSEAYY